MVVHEEKGTDVVSWTLTIKNLRSTGKDDWLEIFVLTGLWPWYSSIFVVSHWYQIFSCWPYGRKLICVEKF